MEIELKAAAGLNPKPSSHIIEAKTILHYLNN